MQTAICSNTLFFVYIQALKETRNMYIYFKCIIKTNTTYIMLVLCADI